MLNSRPTVVELFGGAGLFGNAFKQVGFNIIRAVEKDAVAAATYAKNVFHDVEVADIRKVTPTGRCDVLIAGPPCQGFSTLGRRNPNDPRNRLSWEVVRWSRKLRPKVVVIENVTAFLDSPNWRQITNAFKRDGLKVSSFILNAIDYGCAQIRERSFTFAHSTNSEIVSPRRRPSCNTVAEAWEGLSRRPDGKNHHYSPRPSAIALARMRVIPVGGDKRDVMKRCPQLAPPSWWHVSCEVTDAWGRMRWSEPANTLRTCFQNASKGRYIHPTQNRVISLREAARLHSIDDEWEFVGLPTQIARQIGNSVPPCLGRAVARSVLRTLGG
jgi:DNA (cytosine-5)-methyltransferase 1